MPHLWLWVPRDMPLVALAACMVLVVLVAVVVVALVVVVMVAVVNVCAAAPLLATTDRPGAPALVLVACRMACMGGNAGQGCLSPSCSLQDLEQA